jgi:MYXO-CTERM domain-containing protein
MEEDYGPFLLTLNGSFSSPATGDACSAAFFLGEEFVGGDSVSGPITYDLSGGGSAVPLPTGASSGLVALLGLGGLLALRRRRMAIGS